MFCARIAFAVMLGLFLYVTLPESLDARDRDDYRKAVETRENVLRKKFAKKKKIELSIGGGGIINQSYQQSFMVQGTLHYFFSEVWGLGVEGGVFLNSDKSERTCIENFYNDFDGTVEAATGRVCNQSEDPAAAQQDLSAGGAGSSGQTPNMGPAYVPIREKSFMIGAHLIWNPIYGKQLLLLKSTGYFDVFTKMGGGIMMADFYPQSQLLRNGTPSRASAIQPGQTPGTTANDTNNYGVLGRPDVQSETNFYVMLGLGQKYHFAKRMHISVEIKNYTLLFTEETGFDNFFTLSGGVGFRF